MTALTTEDTILLVNNVLFTSINWLDNSLQDRYMTWFFTNHYSFQSCSLATTSSGSSWHCHTPTWPLSTLLQLTGSIFSYKAWRISQLLKVILPMLSFCLAFCCCFKWVLFWLFFSCPDYHYSRVFFSYRYIFITRMLNLMLIGWPSSDQNSAHPKAEAQVSIYWTIMWNKILSDFVLKQWNAVTKRKLHKKFISQQALLSLFRTHFLLM